MDFTIVGILGIISLLVLLGLGVHLVIDFLIVALVGTSLLIGLKPALSMLGDTLYYSIASPTFCVLPLFILMGSFAARGGFASTAYENAHILAARIPASLAIATSFGSAIFASICGSSLATATIFGKLAYPQMKKYGYDKFFTLGSISSSGTFACMIPPSGMFILFAIFTEQSVGRLFMAGIIPGLLTATIYAISMIVRAKMNPTLAPVVPSEKDVTVKNRFQALGRMWPIFFLATLVIGGIYSGIFTSTEAGAAGALGALVFGLWQGKLRRMKEVKGALRESARTTSMLMFIIIAALYFSKFLALTQIPTQLADFLQNWDVPPLVILTCIMGVWLVLGMFIVQAAVFALTLPILFPVVVALGYDPVWFCVIAMKLNEIAGVTPPVGLNAFGLAGVTGDGTKVEDVFMGVWPFILCDVIVLIMLFLFPQIVLYLPNAMLGN